MRIGVDIDGTIKDTRCAAVQVYNEVLNRNVKPEEVTDFYLDKAYGLSPGEGAKLWRKWEHRIYSLGVPLKGAAETLWKLQRRGHEIYFITARPGMKHIADVTKRWLQRHGFPYDPSRLRMSAQDKAKIARELGIQLFFEDAPKHLDRLVEEGIPTVIVDAVYNRDYPGDLPRIKSWDEVFPLVEELENHLKKE